MILSIDPTTSGPQVNSGRFALSATYGLCSGTVMLATSLEFSRPPPGSPLFNRLRSVSAGYRKSPRETMDARWSVLGCSRFGVAGQTQFDRQCYSELRHWA